MLHAADAIAMYQTEVAVGYEVAQAAPVVIDDRGDVVWNPTADWPSVEFQPAFEPEPRKARPVKVAARNPTMRLAEAPQTLSGEGLDGCFVRRAGKGHIAVCNDGLIVTATNATSLRSVWDARNSVKADEPVPLRERVVSNRSATQVLLALASVGILTVWIILGCSMFLSSTGERRRRAAHAS